MIPSGGIQLTEDLVTESQQTSRTYALNIAGGRISGFVDGLDAVKQAVFKILQTERFEHFIYSFDYGFESMNLIGGAAGYMKSELKRRIQEALLQDDRITGVSDFEMTVEGDSALVTFQVQSDYGDFLSTMEVKGNV
ncbi:DUF2634 domain-containing protein [Paenibacillus radicis (ex Gao et al. 2016)]|uniref:DUF2634 domain-containing protein n=1 Tax=Paenibacillus radicis (ex Gao et al. 2016) TaxID=1737354 RepID=A0A917HK57_9BACL|nr:DUF2634 domain-containing protein [Paenibacillus radicis (ex Gao et al. 2016)]GGG81760.1 hypothetical protein GCM10010918_43800 [Paenibacillus radicis (ex Gao et al. 2016)]